MSSKRKPTNVVDIAQALSASIGGSVPPDCVVIIIVGNEDGDCVHVASDCQEVQLAILKNRVEALEAGQIVCCGPVDPKRRGIPS